VYFVIGLVIVVVTVANVLFTLVLPRRPAGIDHLSLVVDRTVRRLLLALSRLVFELPASQPSPGS
jgi:hypothetical protein